MFGTCETTVAATYGQATGRLVEFLKHSALETVSRTAYDSGQRLLTQIGPFGGVAGLSKLVRIHFLDPRADHDTLSLALRWEATGAAGGLFPVLDADLILAPDGEATRMRLLYSYRPPLGKLGAALDAAVLKRVADATIRTLLDNVGELLADPRPEPVEHRVTGILGVHPT
ncbi:hypothetical protein GCM10010172_10690 [Paractinoplanes ferrugineus]|uniref:Uncharacterized protein n=1 Tax=Paractinoplanes ferrugineus TaxID=113564 RepID=A0A919MBE7_9ACTN|nr:hypothetical protein [Actinoplanes ferrugineus]GIE09633.1 hypothetical protein Afe05nite_14730 [Actinoplanes ferrugineus]